MFLIGSEERTIKKWLRISLITIISLILLLAVAFFIYVSDYYRADDVAIAVMQSGAATQVVNVGLKWRLIPMKVVGNKKSMLADISQQTC